MGKSLVAGLKIRLFGIFVLYVRLAKSNFVKPSFSPMDNPLQETTGRLQLVLNLFNLPPKIMKLFIYPNM